ncbi:DotU family type IV/VI secretion system protein [Snodgrassella sp. ESL0253]|uniref:DotU family type IV/VI secretion system protein n=1 Tax=Snodgrassella sp. ESL0253 TaxID=2705031 RepID=UPI0015829986|nr:DotU/TssL family secretion system protein [Snodgrassella sp. ESL0253]NUE67133.1 DotU family type IV/VI secretion system protein [Snodgrassella sp. ESL0253]
MKNNQIPDYVRENLRNYILFVTRLNMGHAIQNMDEMQLIAVHLVTEFDQKLGENHLPDHERKQIRYALYALVDELALRFLDSKNKLIWESSPLQVSQFGEYDAGIQLFEDIQTELHKPDPSYWLLTIWQLIFALGFNGKYLFEETHIRNELITKIDSHLPEITMPSMPASRKLRPVTFRSFSAVSWSVVLLVFTIVVYLVLNKYLSNLVASIG